MDRDLFNTVVENVDLPKELITKELQQLLDNAKVGIQELSLDDLRKIMTRYLQEVFVEAKSSIISEEL